MVERDGLHETGRCGIRGGGLGVVGPLARLGRGLHRSRGRRGGRHLRSDTLGVRETQDETGGEPESRRSRPRARSRRARGAPGPPVRELLRAHAPTPPMARALDPEQRSNAAIGRRSSRWIENVQCAQLGWRHSHPSHALLWNRERKLFSANLRAASTVDANSTGVPCRPASRTASLTRRRLRDARRVIARLRAQIDAARIAVPAGFRVRRDRPTYRGTEENCHG